MTGSQAIGIIVKFPVLINNVAQAVAKIPLGPWIISVNCTYGGCHKESYSDGVQFSTAPLVQALDSAESHAKTFNTDFQPVNTWLKTTLPAFNTTFNGASAVLLKILNAAQSSGKLTPDQKKEMAKQFTIIQNGLTTSKTELEQGSTAMLNFVKAQNAITSSVAKIQSQLEANVQAALNSLLAATQGQHCGQSDAQAQFNVIEAQYKSSVSQFNTEFSTFSTDTQNANTAVDTVVALVTNYILQIQNISSQLQTVEQGNLSVFLQEVKVQASTQLWSNLAKAAKSSFGANALQIQAAELQFEMASV